MASIREKSNKNNLHIIRVSPEIHHIAKIAACQKLLTLQAWIEQLIAKEVRKENQ